MTEIELQQLLRTDVPRETFNKFQAFIKIIIEWQNYFNLVSRGTISQIWDRHLYDCYQLKNYLPDTSSKIVDIGSGAGFPGIVLAILGFDICLVESNHKKVQFLTHVIKELDLNTQIIHDRIEELRLKSIDIFMSRAVAPLSQLLKWTFPSFNKNSRCMFMKGECYQSEILAASQQWNFDYILHPSLTHEKSMIVTIKKLSKRR